MVKDKYIIYNDSEYMEIVKDILNNDIIQKMKLFRQHYNVSCFDHCLYVSYNLYRMCKKFNLDYISAARAGMVHDLFLYDWRKRINGRKGLHAFTHPRLAYENAQTIMTINKIEKDIIIKHMWPLTLSFPKYRETLLMIYIDKCFAIMEKYINSEKMEELL